MFNPVAGISFIISVIILVVGIGVRQLSLVLHSSNDVRFTPAYARKKIMISWFIFLIFTSIYVWSLVFLLGQIPKYGNHGIVTLVESFIPCEAVPSAQSEFNVILRLDDVQAYGWSDVSMQMMKDAHVYNFPIVAGIIPKNISEEPRLVHFLRRNACNIEFALHGYDHGEISDYVAVVGEFQEINYTDAIDKLQAGKKEIATIGPVSVVTFIPPQNMISVEGELALRDENLYLSKTGNSYFDIDAKTWSYEYQEPISATEVMRDCQRSYSAGDNLCVIMLHPQDYVDSEGVLDMKKYEEYRKLLHLVSRSEVAVVRFSDMITVGS